MIVAVEPTTSVMSVSSVTPLVKKLFTKVGHVSPAPPAPLTVPPEIVPPFMRSDPVVAVRLRVAAALSSTPVRLVVPPVLVSVPRLAVANVPPRFNVPFSTASVLLLSQLPASDTVPALAWINPLLVQFVPVTVTTPLLLSARIVPWLSSPSSAAPTVPPEAAPVVWIVIPEPIVSVPAVGCTK